MPSRRAISCAEKEENFSRMIARAWRMEIRSAGIDCSLDRQKSDLNMPAAAPVLHEITRAGSSRNWGAIISEWGRDHSVTGGAIIQELGGAFVRNLQPSCSNKMMRGNYSIAT
ncbi:hypothetical protein K9U39_17485 [Rhodoblastus acidophilus]|nr:hypothetical protein [Rhodoblastus acidophilus]